MSYTFSHIVNVVGKEENAELFSLQEISLQSFGHARKNLNSGVSVEVICVAGPSGPESVPHADRTVRLNRTVDDVGTFSGKRKLPLISDILDSGVAASNGDYIVFTNADIILTPTFYNVVAHYLSKGKDALVINRRRIPYALKNEPYEVMVAHAGKAHSGWDCFVFKKSLYERFLKTQICIGIPMAGNDIFYNIFTFAETPELLTNQHLTFHLGMDLVKVWGSPEYYAHNRREFRKLLKQLKPQMKIAKFPGAGLSFFKRHFRWLMNPTYDYRTMFSVDMSQLSLPRPKPRKPEIPGLAQRYYEWMLRKIDFREND